MAKRINNPFLALDKQKQEEEERKRRYYEQKIRERQQGGSSGTTSSPDLSPSLSSSTTAEDVASRPVGTVANGNSEESTHSADKEKEREKERETKEAEERRSKVTRKEEEEGSHKEKEEGGHQQEEKDDNGETEAQRLAREDRERREQEKLLVKGEVEEKKRSNPFLLLDREKVPLSSCQHVVASSCLFLFPPLHMLHHWRCVLTLPLHVLSKSKRRSAGTATSAVVARRNPLPAK